MSIKELARASEPKSTNRQLESLPLGLPCPTATDEFESISALFLLQHPKVFWIEPGYAPARSPVVAISQSLKQQHYLQLPSKPKRENVKPPTFNLGQRANLVQLQRKTQKPLMTWPIRAVEGLGSWADSLAQGSAVPLVNKSLLLGARNMGSTDHRTPN